MTRHDIWKTASPWEDGEDCCEECFSPSQDVPTEFGERAVPQGCKDEDCFCHATKEDILAMKGEERRDER